MPGAYESRFGTCDVPDRLSSERDRPTRRRSVPRPPARNTPRSPDRGCSKVRDGSFAGPDLAIERNPATGLYDVNLKYCKGCGICVEECPRGAIQLTAEEQR